MTKYGRSDSPQAGAAPMAKSRGGVFGRVAIGGVLIAALTSSPSAHGTMSNGIVRGTTAGGITYVTKSYTLNRGQSATFKAPCPSGLHVMGGGFEGSGGFLDLVVAHSYPYDSGDSGTEPDDGWAADVRGFNENHTVKIYATCSNYTMTYVTAEATVQQRRNGFADAVCPESAPSSLSTGSRGPRTVQESETQVLQNNAAQQNGYVAASNLDNEPRTLTVITVCASIGRQNVSFSATASARSQTTATVLCPPATPYAVSGGMDFTSLPPFAQFVRTRSRPNGTGSWRSSIDNYSANDRSFDAWVICIQELI